MGPPVDTRGPGTSRWPGTLLRGGGGGGWPLQGTRMCRPLPLLSSPSAWRGVSLVVWLLRPQGKGRGVVRMVGMSCVRAMHEWERGVVGWQA